MAIVFSLLDYETATVIFGARDAQAQIGVEALPSTVLVSDGGPPQTNTRPSQALPGVVLEPNAAGASIIDTSLFPDGVGAVRLTMTEEIVAAVGVRTRQFHGVEDLVDRHSLRPGVMGTQFRIPYIDDRRTQRVRVAVTAVDAPRLVRIRSPKNEFPDVEVGVPADHTLAWTKGLEGSGTLLITADGPIAVSAVLRRSDPSRLRIYPWPS